MEFIEAPAFTRNLPRYMDDEGYRALQERLASAPDLGDVMPGTGGFRKARWADKRRQKGRRGGLRVIYYHFAVEKQIWLMTLFDKDEMEDLSAAQKKALRAAVEDECAARASMKERR
jgi:hypothetical protein